MAGLAKTKSFMLSAATIMIGPANKLHQLNPQEHSIGLAKNFQMTADPTYVELTQGLNNVTVMSVKNSEGLRASFEVYEYTLRNLAYAAGLDASGVDFDPIDTIWVTASDVQTNKTVTVASDITDSLQSGDYVFLQNGIDDKVHIAKVATVEYDTVTTITFAQGYETPSSEDVTFPAGCRIGKVKRVNVGGSLVQPEMGVKVVGLLPKDNAPFTILMPKVKITRGLGVAFQTDNFGNLPFELTPYAGVPGDPFYGEYGEAVAILFPR